MATSDRILKILKEQPTINQKQLAKELGISEAAVSKWIKKLGLKATWTAYGKTNWQVNSEVNSGVINPSTTLSPRIPIGKLNLRLHRLQRSYLLLAKIDASKLTGLTKLSINHTDQYIGKGFRVTSKHLELEGIQLTSTRITPVAILEGVAITIADNLARSLAEQYGLAIDIVGTSPPKLMEVELTAHDMAERVDEKGIIELYNKDGYKVWIDHSFGLGSLESNKLAYIQKLTDFTNDIVENRWGISQQLELNQELIKDLDFFARNINMHVDWMYNALRASREGRILPKRPKPIERKQRRL